MNKWQKVTIDNLSGGDAKDKLNFAISEAIANCLDLNRDYKPKRVVTLKIVLEPQENRRDIGVTAQASTKLVPDKPCTDFLAVDEGGTAYTNSAHQMDMDRAIMDGAIKRGPGKSEPQEEIDDETGEVKTC